MKILEVKPNQKQYNIVIGNGILNHMLDYINIAAKKIFIVTDDNVEKFGYLDKLKQSFSSEYDVKSIVLPHGEKTKNYSNLMTLYKSMIEFNLTRKDVVIALGGGVIGDLTGFCAATYLRGVDFIQVPTTLLAQVDSSVGGKVAVDLLEGKNLVGAFYQPKLVLADLDCLKTLPDYFYEDGMGEVIKYGAIKDEKLFSLLETIHSRDEFMKHSEDIIYQCCNIKRMVVEEDEFDKGERMLLNFGHTYGHAIEKFYNYDFSHGQAVAIGMCTITKITEKIGLSKEGTYSRLANLCKQFNLKDSVDVPVKDLISTMKVDKKNLGSNLMLIIISEIGKSQIYKSKAEFFVENEC